MHHPTHHTLLILIACIGLAACASVAPTPTAITPSETAVVVESATPTPEATESMTITPAPTAVSLSLPDTLPPQITGEHGAVMLLIPAGEFTMGSDQGFRDELPIHQVTLDAYYLDQMEATNQQYQACVDVGVCAPPLRTDCCTTPALVMYPTYFGDPRFADYPVTWISWQQAKTFCEWRGARLPTEAEWEKAARGVDGRTYPWGNDAPTPNRLNFTWEPGEFGVKPLYATSKVGSYPSGASPYGILDMAGNVYEWVSDRYDPDYYAVSPARNPLGPKESKYRIARGGSFFNQAWRNRSSNRSMDAFLPPDRAEFDAGARCAKNIP